jgi:hypothetical protein
LKRHSNQQITLKPQDLVVLLKLLSLDDRVRTFNELGSDLAISASEVHASVGRAMKSRLLNNVDEHLHVAKAALREFLLHGAKYAFPPTFGAATRGVPTAYAAPPLASLISQPSELAPVWPDPAGERRGMALHPLYPTVPKAARADPVLYESLALFDALRSGAARERELASQLLGERLT